MSLMLIAQAHNAEMLERYCIHFIAMNEGEIKRTKAFKDFERKSHKSLFDHVSAKIKEEH